MSEERITESLRALERAPMPPGLADRVMLAVREEAGARARHRQSWRAAFAWLQRLGWAAAGAAVALVLARGPAPQIASPEASPEVRAPAGTVPVRFTFVRSGARSVCVVGDFNGWSPERTPLSDDGTGVWSAMVPLPPGQHQYQFVVDGATWVEDPVAPEFRSDGFGSRNSVLRI